MEPHGIVADWRADGLTVYMSTQFTAGVRARTGARLWPAAQPGARRRRCAWAAASARSPRSATTAASPSALSRQAGAPVRLVLDRQEEQIDSGNRPATWQRLRIGARRDGALTAISLLSYGTRRHRRSAPASAISPRALYACANFEASQLRRLHQLPARAAPCARPGNTPGAFGLEQAIDELAEKLGMDPLALRDRIDPSPARREERRHRRRADRLAASGMRPAPIRARSSAGSAWRNRCGARTCRSIPPAKCACCATARWRCCPSVQDIGTGIGTVLAQTVAEVLGLRPKTSRCASATPIFPQGPPSHGSRTTASITPPARTAAWRVRSSCSRDAAPSLNVAADDLVARGGRIVVSERPARGMAFREAAAQLRTDRISAVASRSDDYGGLPPPHGRCRARRSRTSAACNSPRSRSIPRPGIVRVERVVAVQDCGRPMNPRQIESQVQGGVLHGPRPMPCSRSASSTGIPAAWSMPNLEQYKLAGPRETPADRCASLLENYQGQSATDAYGIAEPRQYRHRAGDRQRHLQRDRRAPARACR